MTRSIVIVGAGPAGLSAAIEAVRHNCDVTLIDEGVQPGGQIYRQRPAGLVGREYAEPGELARKDALLQRFAQVRGSIDYRSETSVFSVFGNREVHVSRGGSTEVLRPDAIILATGVREMALPFRNWTLPGVMFAGGAQAVLKAHDVLPGRRAVVAGSGPLPLVVAAQIIRAGGEVAALAMLHGPGAMLRHPLGLWHGRGVLREGLRYGATVLRSGTPRLTGYVPIEAHGDRQVEGVTLARVAHDGGIEPGTHKHIACDLVAVNYGFLANSELAAMAGAAMRYDPLIGGWLPVTDDAGRTSVAGIYAAGDGAGLRGALVAEADGLVTAAAACEADAASLHAALALRRRHEAFQPAVRQLLPLPPQLWAMIEPETIICRCETVRMAEIDQALGEGHRTLNAIKRNTRAGMGWCQGRNCLHAISARCAARTGAPPSTMMTPRPLARPVTLAALAQQVKAASP